MARLSVPCNSTPGIATVTSPPISPARPAFAPFLRMKKPKPPSSETKSVTPSPKPALTFLAIILTTVSSSPLPAMPSAPAVDVCSKAKSPLTYCPSISRFTSLPSTRRYGPAGSASVIFCSPILNCSLTALDVVLIDNPKVPSKLTAVSPGMANVTVPESSPATPAGVRTKKPDPSVSRTPASSSKFNSVPLLSPRNRPTFVAAIRTILGATAPGLLCAWGLNSAVTCSKAKSPVRVWPRMVILVPIASTRIDSAGISGVLTPESPS